MIVVALDPGQTTGYAIYDTETEELVGSGELFGNFRGCIDYILSLDAGLYIAEDFRVRHDAARGLSKLERLWPVEWLGALRYHVPDKLLTQTPSQAKAQKKIWLVESTHSAHEADAIRHLQVYLDGRRGDTSDRLKSALQLLTTT